MMGPRPIRPAWLRWAAVFALGIGTAVAGWWPMIVAKGGPTSDGRYFFYTSEIAKAAVRLYGEVPLWNPFDCAGIEMWDHPEAIVASPLFALLLPASTEVTLWAWQLYHLAIGFLGMWLLCRDELRVSRAAAFVGAWLFSTGAGAAGQYAGLHATMMSFAYLPLLLVLWRRAEKSVDAALGAGVLVALMVYDGATYPLPFCILALAAETSTRMWPARRALRIASRGLLAAAIAAGLASARLLPLAVRLRQGARDIPPDVDSMSLRALARMFTWREDNTWSVIPGQQYHWHEYIAYVGFLGVIMALVGLVIAARSHRWTLIVGAVAFLLMLGNFAWFAPWSLLRGHVFPFQSMRVPSRFRHIFLVFLCAWIALAIDRLPVWVRRFTARRRVLDSARAAVVALGVLAAGDSMALGSTIVAHRYEGDPAHPRPPSPRFYYGGEGLAPDWMDQPSQNRAYTGCRASFAFRNAAPIWTGDAPPARSTSELVTVLGASRTHNTFTVEVDAAQPGRVLLDSAYDEGWRTSVGSTMSHEELLSVDVPAGRHTLRLHYWPRLFTEGIAVTLATALLVVVLFARRRSAIA